MMKSLRSLLFKTSSEKTSRGSTHDPRALFSDAEEQSQPDGSRLFRPTRYGAIRAGIVELFLSSAPRLTPRSLEFRLRSRGQDVNVREVEPGLWAAEFPRIRVALGIGEHPAIVFLEVPLDPLGASSEAAEPAVGALPALSADALASLRSDVRSSAFAIRFYEKSALLPPALRLELLTTVVATTMEMTAPTALFWRSAQKFIDPAQFVRACRDFSLDAIVPFVTTVRQMRVPLGGGRVLVTDTRGLFDFGIPDVQLQAEDMAPTHAARLVLATAQTLWANGHFAPQSASQPVRVSSDRSSPLCQLRYELALLAPLERVVLALAPILPSDPERATRGPSELLSLPAAACAPALAMKV